MGVVGEQGRNFAVSSVGRLLTGRLFAWVGGLSGHAGTERWGFYLPIPEGKSWQNSCLSLGM